MKRVIWSQSVAALGDGWSLSKTRRKGFMRLCGCAKGTWNTMSGVHRAAGKRDSFVPSPEQWERIWAVAVLCRILKEKLIGGEFDQMSLVILAD
jgi:hypothetical protein